MSCPTMYDALVSADGGCGSNGRHGRTIYRQIVGEICLKFGADLPDMALLAESVGTKEGSKTGHWGIGV